MAQAIARRFRTEGAEVLVAGIKMNELLHFAGEIGARATFCDITKSVDLTALAELAVEHWGTVSIAVNSTGWGLVKPFLETTSDELARITALQYIGPFQFFQAMVRVMTRGASLIQVSSAAATIMLANHAAYMGTKAGTDHVIRCVANDFGERGIRANSISPGITDTPMMAKAKAVGGIFEAFLPAYPLGRLGTSEDVAAAAVWLASDECFMTGENLQVNGGLTLRRNPTAKEIAASVSKAKNKD
jgi:NAD(P)-dependent dehydrogenase (short-subunit alcohol dehydrogenase family)